jgi:hypothetical protein
MISSQNKCFLAMFAAVGLIAVPSVQAQSIEI